MRCVRLACFLCFGLLAGCGEPEPTNDSDSAAAPVKAVVLTPADLREIRVIFASPEPEAVRRAVTRVVASVEPIPWLLEGLLDPNRGVREWSAHALGDLAPQDDGVVRALIVRFEDEDDYVRWKAARALGNIGWPARIAFPLLAVAAGAKYEDEVEVVRAAARVAIRKIRRAGRYRGPGAAGIPVHSGLPDLAPWELEEMPKPPAEGPPRSR